AGASELPERVRPKFAATAKHQETRIAQGFFAFSRALALENESRTKPGNRDQSRQKVQGKMQGMFAARSTANAKLRTGLGPRGACFADQPGRWTSGATITGSRMEN